MRPRPHSCLRRLSKEGFYQISEESSVLEAQKREPDREAKADMNQKKEEEKKARRQERERAFIRDAKKDDQEVAVLPETSEE